MRVLPRSPDLPPPGPGFVLACRVVEFYYQSQELFSLEGRSPSPVAVRCGSMSRSNTAHDNWKRLCYISESLLVCKLQPRHKDVRDISGQHFLQRKIQGCVGLLESSTMLSSTHIRERLRPREPNLPRNVILLWLSPPRTRQIWWGRRGVYLGDKGNPNTRPPCHWITELRHKFRPTSCVKSWGQKRLL